MGVSRSAKAPPVVIVGRLIDAFNKNAARRVNRSYRRERSEQTVRLSFRDKDYRPE